MKTVNYHVSFALGITMELKAVVHLRFHLMKVGGFLIILIKAIQKVTKRIKININ